MSKKGDLIIIGAGVAGLYAATRLAEHFNITFIESREQPGGRIRSLKLANNRGVVEGGAEFVHGHLPITESLIREAVLTPIKFDGKMYRKENDGFKEQDEMVEGWDAVLKKMDSESVDMTLTDLLNKYFHSEKYRDLRQQVISYAEGFDLADPETVSVKSLYAEWSNEEEQLKLKEGYGALVTHLYNKALAENCRFLFGDRVKEIHWEEGRVEVVTASGNKVAGNKVMVTVPPPVVCNHHISFSPTIPAHFNAFADIGYGTVVKLVYEFSKSFWKEDMGFVFSQESIPTWWSQYPEKTHLLTGWAGGLMAEKLSHLSDEELSSLGLDCLSSIFNLPIADLRNILIRSHVFNWIKDEDALGAYSFSTPKSKSARILLNTPIANTLFFAGESLVGGTYPGTVEAAMKSGSLTAREIQRSL